MDKTCNNCKHRCYNECTLLDELIELYGSCPLFDKRD